MSNSNKEKLEKIFLDIFQDIKNFDFDKDRSEFENWDSLNHMQLVSEIESQFKINFEMDEISEINKPQDLLDLINKKQNG